jgi:hypothetical protein
MIQLYYFYSLNYDYSVFYFCFLFSLFSTKTGPGAGLDDKICRERLLN